VILLYTRHNFILTPVIKAIDELEKKYRRKFREKFKTIIVDNGTEFLDYRGIEKSKIEPGKDRTKV